MTTAEGPRFRNVAVGLIAGWLALFVLVPNLLVILISFLRRDESELIAWDFSLDSYLRLIDPLFLQVFVDSFLLALLVTGLCLLVGFPFAFLIARARPRWRPLLLLLVIIPFWTNSLIRTYAIKAILATSGTLNDVLLGLGLIDAPLRLLYTGSAVTIGMVYVLLPFMVLPLYAAIEKLDWRLVEAARDLGAGFLATFRRVVLPLTLPGVIAGSLLVFLPALGLFYVADLLGGAKDLILGNFIKNQFLDARDWPFGAAASVVLTLLMALLLLLYWRSVAVLRKEEAA